MYFLTQLKFLMQPVAFVQANLFVAVSSHFAWSTFALKNSYCHASSVILKLLTISCVGAFSKMSLSIIITKIREQTLSADLLLSNSGELLNSVVEIGGTVGNAANNLKAAILNLDQTNDDNTVNAEATRARMKKTAIHTANGVVQLSAQAALSIRRVIGWDNHPYLPEQRNGGSTLIGIERALNQLSAETTALASSWVNENYFTDIRQRISAMVLAAERNTRTANANAVAVEAVGAVAIKIARSN